MIRRGAGRPERFLGQVTGAVVLLFAWAAVAHASGSGWVQTLGALAAGILLVGMLGPGLALRGARLSVVRSAPDATTGQPVELRVVSSRSCRCTPLRPSGAQVALVAGVETTVKLLPSHRGFLQAVDVRVATAAPFGLLWWSMSCRLQLPGRLVVAPVPGEVGVVGAAEAAGEAAVSAPEASVTGDARGIREYRAGDSPRLVHWRATAHSGSLMVRESETHPDLPLHVVADLAQDPDEAELQASAALGTVRALLGAGRRVVLDTTESEARCSSLVADVHVAGRRLGLAGRNPWDDLG
ncbi:MAG: DUF58 domain-containing protein [Acidimicrobiales bacterium]